MNQAEINQVKDSTGQEAGRVVQIIGPVIDVAFPSGQLPEIYTAIRITSEGFDVPVPIDIIVEVEQHIGDFKSGVYPCIQPMAWPGG
jgi:F0F1-type ATP synthase beta subunit